MKVTRGVGTLAAAFVAVVIILVGLATGTGIGVVKSFAAAFSGAWNAAWTAARQNLGGVFPTGVAGHAGAAVIIALALFTAGVIFVPPVRQGRGMVVLATFATVVGFVLYNPSMFGGGG